MAAQAEGLGDNGCEVLHQPFRLLVWKGKQKTWFLSVISPTRSHTSILKQYVSGRGKRWTVYVSGWSRQLGQACIGFSCQGLGPWSTAPSLPGQTLSKGGTSLQSPPYKWSQVMTGRSGHERAVGLRVGSQGCCWVTWNIYAKLKKKKKIATSSGMIQPKYRGQGLENEWSPQTVPFGQGAIWTNGDLLCPGLFRFCKFINGWSSSRTWVQWCSRRVGPSLQGFKWLVSNMEVFKDLYLAMDTSFSSFLSTYLKITVTMGSFTEHAWQLSDTVLNCLQRLSQWILRITL